MKIANNLLCLLLAAAMALSLCGCFRWGGKDPIPNHATEAPATESTTESASEQPTDTDAPTEAPAVTPEAQPTEQGGDADALFDELDLEIFQSAVTASADSYNQCIVADPARFGIAPEDVEAGWGDFYSEQDHKQYMDTCREMLQRLEAIDRTALSSGRRTAYDAVKRYYEMELLTEDYYYYEEPLTPVNGFHTSLPLAMVCFALRAPEDVETYVDLLEDMPRVIDQIAQFEVGKAEHGLFMTETALEQVVESCESFAATGEDCFLISYFDTVEAKALELGMTQAECDALRERSDNAVLSGILPAYSRLAETLVDLTGDCTELAGAAELGSSRRAYYDISVQREAGTMQDVDDIIDMIEDMGDDMLSEMIYAMYSDPDSLDRYGEPITFGSIDEDMAWLADFTAKYYPDMPEYNVEYITIPEDIAEDFSPAAYLTPAYDDYYDNTILINPTSDDATMLLTLAHEGIPGHMYQFLSFRATEGLSLAQQVLTPTGYAEGWTVFTEYFVAHNCRELGAGYCTMMNAESVYGNIFLPAYVSLQVNHNGWTLEDVISYLDAMQMGDYADMLYEYAVTMPVYAISYAVGFASMYNLYNDYAPKTPQQHKEFFSEILSAGPTYLDLLGDWMNAGD